MTGTFATADNAFFSPSPPRGMIRSTTPSWPASSASCSRPPETSETAPSGNSAETIEASTALEWAALDERRGVYGHVRPRLVDHRDHAERHPHLADVEPVGQPVAVDHLADGIGQGGD